MKLDKVLKRHNIKRIGAAAGIVEYRLPNGLKILLKENHAAPVTSFMVVYKVGSRNEGVGYTGATHFLEHMMFKGTRKFNPSDGTGVMETFDRIGALLNATTWLDRTNYFECVGVEHLELCIQVEADRMRNLRLRQEDRDSEMTVVRNEFERGENDPREALDKEMWAVAFREHPYHHPTIGWRSDVEGVPMARMKEFYDTYYWPNNASAIVVGDFDPAATLNLIAKHFGKIPRSPRAIPQVYTVEPPQQGERRFRLKRAGDLPQLAVAYHNPAARHADTYGLSAIAMLLGNEQRRSSRLYKQLIETGLATEVSAHNGEFRDPSLFEVTATLAPSASFEQVESVIYAELERLAREPASDEELNRARSANRKGTVLANDDPMGFANAICQAEASADWRWLTTYDVRFDAISKDDIMRIASTYFHADNRTVGHFIPTNDEDRPCKARTEEQGENPKESPTSIKKKKSGKVGKQSSATGKSRRLKLAPPRAAKEKFSARVTREVLSNGLTVMVLPGKGTGSVAVQGFVHAGDCFAPASQDHLASITSAMLTRGSKKYSKGRLAEILEAMGTLLDFRTDSFGSHFGTLLAKEDLPLLIEVITDLLQNPLFAAAELEETVRQVRANLTRQENDTGSRADMALSQAIYPESHPFYERSHADQIQQLDSIQPGDLQDFHRKHFTPQSTVIAVVGDVEAQEALALVCKNLSSWTGGPRQTITIPQASLPHKQDTIEVNLADKANVDIVIGHPTALARTSDDYYAAYIANAALGQDTISSRLGKTVRVKHGLTYGIFCRFHDLIYGGGPWYIELSVNQANMGRAIDLVDQVVADYLKKGISAAELQDEIGRAVGSFNVALRSSRGLARALCQFEFNGLGLAGMDSFADSVRSVTKSQVDAALHKYIRPEHFITAMAGTFASRS